MAKGSPARQSLAILLPFHGPFNFVIVDLVQALTISKIHIMNYEYENEVQFTIQLY